MRSLLLTAALAGLALSASASANTSASAVAAEPAAWTLRTFDVYAAEDRRKPLEERRIAYSGVIVHTSDTSRTGALFSCSEEKGLSVMFSLAPVDFTDEDYFASSQQVRGMGGRVIVDGERPRDASRFLYRRKLNVAQAAQPEVAYAAVEALYKGQTTQVEVGGLRAVEVSLPAPDEAFRQFVRDCPRFVSE
ncbi:hypothetical protein [Hyphomonas sp.]|uniref:hypothetical protein n=1 Tax=Hyphomonas sp. TaxID=87 RepID=UPI00391C9359